MANLGRGLDDQQSGYYGYWQLTEANLPSLGSGSDDVHSPDIHGYWQFNEANRASLGSGSDDVQSSYSGLLAARLG